MLYAVAVFGVLLPMGALFYHLGVAQELEALQQRILTTATALASALDPADVRSLRSPADAGSPAHRRVVWLLASVARADPEMRNLYVMVRGEGADQLRFAADHDRDRPDDVATIGQPYDISRFEVLRRALSAPAVEDNVTVDQWGPSLTGAVPLRDVDGAVYGLLGIDVQGKRIEAARRRVLGVAGAVSVLALALLSVAAWLVGRNVRGPLERMISATERIAAGDLQARLGLSRPDEFGVVGEHFDTMAAGLEERAFIRDTFGRYVSEEVARTLLADRRQTRLGGEVREVTVLFSDLRGYSTISEQLPPAGVVDLLNRYFGAMNDVIDAHDGVVIEFLGDAILAVFGAPNDLPDHAERAVCCAEAMALALERLNAIWLAEGLAERWQSVGLDQLRQRVGIHRGEVVAGNLGSRTRVKYAVIGDTVNVAARLEQLNKELPPDAEAPWPLLFSDAVYEHLSPALVARAVPRGTFQVKGRTQPVRAWSLRRAAAEAAPTLDAAADRS
jgi:adenylate cyclase